MRSEGDIEICWKHFIWKLIRGTHKCYNKYINKLIEIDRPDIPGIPFDSVEFTYWMWTALHY